MIVLAPCSVRQHFPSRGDPPRRPDRHRRLRLLHVRVPHQDRAPCRAHQHRPRRLRLLLELGEHTPALEAAHARRGRLLRVHLARRCALPRRPRHHRRRRLWRVALPAALTIIGHRAFDGCTRLVDLNTPATITFIGHSAFRGCTSLAKVCVPANLSTEIIIVGEDAFTGCPSLSPEAYEAIRTLRRTPARRSPRTWAVSTHVRHGAMD